MIVSPNLKTLLEPHYSLFVLVVLFRCLFSLTFCLECMCPFVSVCGVKAITLSEATVLKIIRFCDTLITYFQAARRM